MIKRFGLSDDEALRRIAEIVHDIDLKDSKFNRLEAPGLSAIRLQKRMCMRNSAR